MYKAGQIFIQALMGGCQIYCSGNGDKPINMHSLKKPLLHNALFLPKSITADNSKIVVVIVVLFFDVKSKQLWSYLLTTALIGI